MPIVSYFFEVAREKVELCFFWLKFDDKCMFLRLFYWLKFRTTKNGHLVSETVAVFNGGDFKCQNHDNHREGYTMIQHGPRQECMWGQSYALFIYVALNFYSASIILHNINNNISY